MKKIFEKAVELTQEEAINHSKKEYNPMVWKNQILRYSKYDNVKFYDLGKGNYREDEVAVVYEVNGIRVFDTLSYSASLSSYDGVIKIIITDFGVYEVKFRDNKGNEGAISVRENMSFLRGKTAESESFMVANNGIR